MWCTRWFLPLLLLPLPTAQPYFLVLFLFSLALHAKPCFYCIVLLGALFLSSCYWQSFPLETRLSIPWSSTITTFYDALNVTLPPNFDLREHTPPIIRVNDRCWCDFTSGVFESYDMQKWERESVERLAADMVQQMKDRAEKLTAEEELPNAEEETSSPEETHLSAIHHTVHVISTQKSTLSALRSMFGQTEAQASPSIADTEPSMTTIPTPTTTLVPSSKPSLMSSPLPPRRPLEYDLNPYGFDLILDFHWS